MDEGYFGPSHQMLRESVRRFIAREIAPHLEEWEEEGIFPRELYHKAAAAGFIGLGYPEEYGGTPADTFHMVAYTEEIVRCGSVGLASGLGSSAIALPPILALGTEEQKRRFIPPVLAGDKVAALAVTEPGGGSDVAGIATRAVRRGGSYVVNGSKTFITSGSRADLVTTAVRTGGSGRGGISLLVVEKGTPGFTCSRRLKKMGWWCSDTAELSFEDCEVPAENLLGNENGGFMGIMVNFQKERLYLAVQAHAVAEMALELSIRYAKERTAFGRTLAGFQVTRHKLAEMATLVEAAKRFDYSVAAMIEAGRSVVKEVCMAKNFATRACEKVVYEAVQIHGGYGFCREYPVERLYRDSRLFAIGGGTYEIMNEVIGRQMGL
ncbi:MAG TPA: acyl-CoA dehydrogenase family protein [Syntrophales bacterium]|nr:acyl-CoA dehydrogenase family protein [Syntrophales bacterium]HOM07552.1 acyl-CoA dehydrogenase family protein [Syntrophales bacterium]HOO00096.1 acyl-CoA dehydrogenase family protein [Syntrophales bacterium]